MGLTQTMKFNQRAIGIIFVLLMAVFSARAAVCTVVNNSNSGTGSLRAAITLANSTPDDDTINFNIPGCESGGCTIEFTGAPGTAVLKIEAAGKLTIMNQPNASNIGISAGNIDRVFEVKSGADLTLSASASVITALGSVSDLLLIAED